MTMIGAFAAKTQLSSLLARVERGESFTITVRGREVARLIPAGGHDVARARDAAKRLRATARRHGAKLTVAELRGYVAEGRR